MMTSSKDTSHSTPPNSSLVSPSLPSTKSVCFILGESSCGQRKPGTCLAPRQIYNNELERELTQLGWTIEDKTVSERSPSENMTLSECHSCQKSNISTPIISCHSDDDDDDDDSSSSICYKCRTIHNGKMTIITMPNTINQPGSRHHQSPVSQAHSAHCPQRVAATCHAVCTAVQSALQSHHFPLLIGGDHSLAMGSIYGASKFFPDLCVLWFDAHTDINTALQSHSGNLHGMPVAALLGLDGMRTCRGFESNPFKCLTPDRIAYIGIRDIDDGEITNLQQLGIRTVFDMTHIRSMGVQRVMSQALHALQLPQKTSLPRSLYLSLDVDGIDPLDMPSTGTPVSGGIRLNEALEMISFLRNAPSHQLVGMDVVEVNPTIGSPQQIAKTLDNTRTIITTALGN